MDTARWLVILTIIFCMISVLTILSRHARIANTTKVIATNQNTEESTLSNTTNKTKTVFKSNSKIDFINKSIVYSPPPKQIFAIDSLSDTEKENSQFMNKGKIE